MTTLYTDISLSTIRVAHERARPVDNRTVADLTKSIAAHGLLQPIGVKATSTGYDLVWGLHRLEAMRQLGQDIIACKVMDADLSDDACRLVELRENLDRNELTGAERKAFAAEVGRLISKLSEKLQVEENSNLQSGWVLELADKIGSSQNTIRNWWGEFTKASGLSITPKHATEENKQQFFNWLEEQKRKADEEKAEKERKEQEERDRRERETIERKQNEDAQEAIIFLEKLAEDWGRDWVWNRVINVFLSNNTETSS